MEKTRPMGSRILACKPPRIAMCLLGIAACLHGMSRTAWLQLPSLPFAASAASPFGFVVMIRAWWLFRREDTAICPTSNTTTLITTDVYRLTRNPMYLGMLLMLLAVALYAGGLFYYVATLTFYAVIDLVFCPYEEQKLGEDFGEAFDNYCNAVRRWI